MHLYVVRHAKAGSRHEWDGPDHLRPLSTKGKHQADGILQELAERNVERVLSSPFVRCIETVQPLADKLGLEVELGEALGEGARTKDVLALVRNLGHVDAVVCSHGDVIPKILEGLASDDPVKVPRDIPCAKGSTWDLVGEDGMYMEAHYIPPPA
ncbi:MAG TPA: phosphoglycerate mutase family protein [Acidimicrobiales bacterium]|nr:phosphoglycerate mutase family protein [Acidimicrobiales bacterium]